MAADIKDDHPGPRLWDKEQDRLPVRIYAETTRVYSASAGELCAVLGIPLGPGREVTAVRLTGGGHVEVTVREQSGE